MIARDWLKTLFPASYRGVPFWVNQDEENGGRRIVVHEFPMRDDPFLEDLGEAKREFEVTAYVASDAADSDAASVISTCAQRGAGILVLPAHGQIRVRCLEFRRDRSKDRHGYIGLQLKFTREGFSGALASVASLANLIYLAADALGGTISASVAATVQTANQPDYVVNSEIDAVQTVAAILEDIRASENVAPEVSTAQRVALQTLYSDAGEVAPAVIADRIVSASRAIGDGLPAASALRVFEGVMVAMAPEGRNATVGTRGARVAAVNAEAIRQATRLAALAAYCEAVTKVALTDRPAGITLRANVAEFCGAEIEMLTPDAFRLYRALNDLRDRTIEYLSLRILDLAPVITVGANLSMPSLFWAWRLYQDPVRSDEIVARNRVMHPSFMPPSFEALGR